MNPLDQLRDEIANLHLLADRLARKGGEQPTIEECQRAAIEATRKLHPNASDLALLLSPDEAAQVAAVRDLCLASRSPSHDLVEAADAMRALFPKAAHDCLLRECSIVDAYDAARAKIGERDAT